MNPVAREARALLEQSSYALEQAGVGSLAKPSLQAAIDALLSFERSASSDEQGRELKHAVKALGEALVLLQGGEPHAAQNAGIEAVARTLALLYPLARSDQRRRLRAVSEAPPTEEPVPESALGSPPAPEPAGPKPLASAFAGLEKRHGGERVFVEVDIGLISDSHFYTGLTRDISRGGVFVATYQPRPPGTHITLFFVLPDGRAVRAEGVVRWVTEVNTDVAPGMGVAFESVSADDMQAIAEFCQSRAPLYHDSGDH